MGLCKIQTGEYSLARLLIFFAFASIVYATTTHAQAVQNELPKGASLVKLEFDSKTEYRVGLVLGELPEVIGGHVVLLPYSALYTRNLSAVGSISSLGSKGKILGIPSIKIHNETKGTKSLHLVGLSRYSQVGTAACYNNVINNQSALIATSDPANTGTLVNIQGKVLLSGQNKSFIELGPSQPQPKIGNPIFINSGSETMPEWQVYGIVKEIDNAAPLRVEALTLPELYHMMPSEAGSWALQTKGLCDPRDKLGEVGYSDELLKLIEEYIEISEMRYLENGPELDTKLVILDFLLKTWPNIKTYLSQPYIEHYYFKSFQNDKHQFGQFWQSVLGLDEQIMEIISPVAAPPPIARIRTKSSKSQSERGWAIAAKYTEGGIILLTANHLVKPIQKEEREILVYLPALQGYPIEGKRLPFVNEELDLATIVVEASKELQNKVFNIYQTACNDQINGNIEVPVNTWGWRLDRHQGNIVEDINNDQLRIKGINIERGFSGTAILKNGNQIAGIITSDLGINQGSVAVNIHAGLKIIPFGELGILEARCESTSTEYEVLDSAVKHIMGIQDLPKPNRQSLYSFFKASDVQRI